MARRLRVQYPGARYYVINRGNYRRDVFETAGAAKAFELTLEEACERHSWRLHAYALMRNHFRLALVANARADSSGRNSLAAEHLLRHVSIDTDRNTGTFQGRYQSPLVEDAAVLVRVTFPCGENQLPAA